MEETEAARYVRAALRLMVERVAGHSDLVGRLEFVLTGLDVTHPVADDPPWSTEPTTAAVPRPWSQVVEGDWARGGDGAYYLVKANRLENGQQYVTIQVKGADRTYPRMASAVVEVKRGPVGLAVDTLEEAGLGPTALE